MNTTDYFSAKDIFNELYDFYTALSSEMTANGHYYSAEAAEDIAITEAHKASRATYEVSPAVLEAYAQNTSALTSSHTAHGVYDFVFTVMFENLQYPF